jgi:hypothetical protein
LRRFLLLSPLVLLTLAVSVWNGGAGSASLCTNADYWVRKSVGDFSFSFWGFVSNVVDENFCGPIVRQGDLDPVNIIFWVDGAGSALERATDALKAMQWKQEDPCLFAAKAYAYFKRWPSHPESRDLHYEFNGCRDKYHIRLFQPDDDRRWAIGAVHHDRCLGFSGVCIWLHRIEGWEEPERALRQDLEQHGAVVDEVCLGNTAGGTWRGVPDDGCATVVRLSGE